MFWRIILSVTLFWSVAAQSVRLAYPPKLEMNLLEYGGEYGASWLHGRTSFKGQVIDSACTLSMEDKYQAVDMGMTPVRDLQGRIAGPEKKFRLQLRNCSLASTGRRVYTAGRVRVAFDGLQGEAPDKFSVIGQARGISLQILDRQGYPARVGDVMPPLLLNGDEEGLDYTLRIIRNGQPLQAGDYYAVLRFKVDYE